MIKKIELLYIMKGAPPKPQRAYSSGAPRTSDGPPRPPDRFVPFQRPANPLFNVPGGSTPPLTQKIDLSTHTIKYLKGLSYIITLFPYKIVFS